MIKFGVWRTLLALLEGQMILLALALFRIRENKLANASLAKPQAIVHLVARSGS
jgi:hypothetical protein